MMTPETLWNHWEGHRRVTLRTLEAFPEERMHDKPVESMRSFAELMTEIVQVEDSVFSCLRSGEWKWEPAPVKTGTKADLLEALARSRAQARAVYSGLTAEKFAAVETDAWGMTSSNLERLLYLVDNEIHHRAQAYVYLRLLGVEPPPFYVR